MHKSDDIDGIKEELDKIQKKLGSVYATRISRDGTKLLLIYSGDDNVPTFRLIEMKAILNLKPLKEIKITNLLDAMLDADFNDIVK